MSRLLCGRSTNSGKPVYYGAEFQEGHCLALGGTGSGKDRRLILPNILLTKGPKIIFDPGAEALGVCGNYLLKQGYQVDVINPKGTLINELNRRGQLKFPHLQHFTSRGYDPCQSLNVHNPSFTTDIEQIIESIFPLDPKEMHFSQRNRQLGSCTLMCECWYANAQARAPRIENWMNLLALPHTRPPGMAGNTLQKLAVYMEAHHYLPMARLAGTFIPETKEIDSVLAGTVSTVKPLMMDTQLHRDLQLGARNGAINWEDYKYNEKQVLFVVLPGSAFYTHAVWLRMLLGEALGAMEKTGPGDFRPVFYLNEIGNIARLDALERAIAMIRKHGVRLWLFMQDLNQAHRVYGEDGMHSILSNMGWISTFASADKKTWDYFGQAAGRRTVEADTIQTGSDKDSGSRHAVGVNVLNADDIRGIGIGKTGNLFQGIGMHHYTELDTPRYDEICKGYDVNPYTVPA
jgi:hypothetical protein